MFRRKIGQSTLEYAVVLVVVVGALIVMQYYIKRGVQGRLRSSIDNVGEQYSAGYTTSTIITEQTSGKVEKVRETTGLTAKGAEPDKESTGIIKTEVVTSAPMHRYTEGEAGKEEITKTLSQENIFDREIK